MKIRDAFAEINGSKDVFEPPSKGIEIMSDDGRVLYALTLKGSVLEIKTSGVVKHGDVILDTQLLVKPEYCNLIKIDRPVYQ